MRAGLAMLTAVVLVSPAHACRLHTIWHFPWKEHCPVMVQQAQLEAPKPPQRQEDAASWLLMPDIDIDIPLPSLEHMEFPPDAPDERLKGVGMLRQLLGTN